jgi:hypothetical protein
LLLKIRTDVRYGKLEVLSLSYSGSRPALTPLAIWAVWPQTITRSGADILTFEGEAVIMQVVEAIVIFQLSY